MAGLINKKAIIVLGVVLILVGVISVMHLFTENNKGYFPKDGIVPDEETAIKIAEVVWLPIYGDSIYSKLPFVAEYNEHEKCWFVYGTSPENTVGGVPEIKINRKDGKVVYISHSK